MKFKATVLCLLAALAVSAAGTPSIYHQGWIDLDKNGKKDVYEDPSQPVEKRVKDLLKRMTLDEKVGQLCQVDMTSDADNKLVAALRAGEVSAFLCGPSALQTPVMRNKLQRLAVEQSRLGIPAL